MHKSFIIYLFLFLFFLIIPISVKANVVINEVFYNPRGVDTGKEYIILYNNGNESADLTNWDLDPSSAPYFTFPKFILRAKQFVKIHINSSGINTKSDIYAGKSRNMANNKGVVALFKSTLHSADTIIDYIEYGKGGQTNESRAVKGGIWAKGDFIPGVKEGYAIKLKRDGQDNNSPSDWKQVAYSLIKQKKSSNNKTDKKIVLTTQAKNTPDAAFLHSHAPQSQEKRIPGSLSAEIDNKNLSVNLRSSREIKTPKINTILFLYIIAIISSAFFVGLIAVKIKKSLNNDK